MGGEGWEEQAEGLVEVSCMWVRWEEKARGKAEDPPWPNALLCALPAVLLLAHTILWLDACVVLLTLAHTSLWLDACDEILVSVNDPGNILRDAFRRAPMSRWTPV